MCCQCLSFRLLLYERIDTTANDGSDPSVIAAVVVA